MVDPQQQPQAAMPAVVIYKLTAGYVLYLDNGSSVACTSVTNVNRAIKNYLGGTPPMRVQAPRPPTRDQIQRNGTLDPALTVEPTPTAAPQRIVKSAVDANGNINPLLAAENLRTLCQAYVDGKLNPVQWEEGVSIACPGVSLKEAKLTLAAYTGTPEPPGHRAPPVRDEQDHYKMAPEIDKPWGDHDQATILDLIEDVPVARDVPVIGLIENSVAETVPATNENGVSTELPAYAEDWMVQDL
jgi:hypothetical protein